MQAEFRSKCATCGEWIEEGDEIEFDEEAEEWVHEKCCET
jgi:hypothetical protein